MKEYKGMPALDAGYRFLLISLALIRCRYELADVYLIRGLVQA